MSLRDSFISLEGFRSDGRYIHERRKIQCSIEVLNSFDGSVIFQVGLTKVLGIIKGPKEPESKGMSFEAKSTLNVKIEYPYNEQKMETKYDKKAEEYAIIIKRTLEEVIDLELYPKTQIDLTLSVLEADGSVLMALINASFLTATHAGLPMKYCFSAASSLVLDEKTIIDPNGSEENTNLPKLTICTNHKGEIISSLLEPASMNADILGGVFKETIKSSLSIMEVLRKETLIYIENNIK